MPLYSRNKRLWLVVIAAPLAGNFGNRGALQLAQFMLVLLGGQTIFVKG
jgi:hypothetical protein